ncbi:MAG: DUF4280 domain-containing protein [Candidatus Nanopelagicales bacterium]
MPFSVTTGSQLTCTMGTTPSAINATPGPVVATTPACTIMDFAPGTNIATFGMCRSPTNPQVAAATTAAQGVLTPQPCVPATASPWTPGAASSFINGVPALTNSSTCTCTWAGVISVTTPGQQLVQST